MLTKLIESIGTEAAKAVARDPDAVTSIWDAIVAMVSGDSDGARAESEKAANRAAGLVLFDAVASKAREAALKRERGE